jgi:hypothetical protein
MTITNPVRGLVTTADLTTGTVVNMDEAIYMISYADAPMTNGVNSDGYQVLPRQSVDQVQFSWLDEERLTPVDALNGAVASAGDTSWVVDNGSKFQVGDLVRADGESEIVRVTAISTNTLTVTRSFGSVAAATTVADNTVLRILGTVLAEGSDPGTARSADRASRTNYTQIHGPDAVNMSRTEMGVRKYGIRDEYSHQLGNRTVEMIQRLEQNLLYGDAVAPAAGLRSSGGFDYFIATNEDSSSTALTPALVETQLQACYDAGGVPDMFTSTPGNIKDLNDIADTNVVRTTIDDPRRGRRRVHTLMTEFGELTIVRNRFCASNNAFMWTQSQAIRRVFDPIIYSVLAKTGDSMKGQIVCEEGLEFKGETHAAKFSALT